jgi:anti-sigma-K factor RskA
MGRLPRHEIEPFERAMRDDPELRALVDELDLGVAAIAMAHATPPPADLRAKILRAAAGQPQSAEEAQHPRDFKEASFVEPSVPRRSRAEVWIPWAVAACLALVCIGLSWRLSSRTSPDNMVIAPLALTPDSKDLEGVATAVWEPGGQRGVLVLKNVPPAPAGHDYQLWILDAAKPDPIDGGVVPRGDGAVEYSFRPKIPASDVTGFAISLEKAGGVPRREGPILFLGTF